MESNAAQKWKWAALLAGLVACLAPPPGVRAEFGENNPRPVWSIDSEMPGDVFTFVRIKYDSWATFRGWEKWTIDFPDAELNFSYRLQQLTSLKVNPDPIYMELTNPDLKNYPFIYIIEPGHMILKEAEVAALRKYLLSGGFLLVDDFWGEQEWENFYREIKRVFPEREPVELPETHPIFSFVFPLKKHELQIPNYGTGIEHQFTGITYERPDATEVHFKGLFDDKGRLMAVICHNTDLGDGWEREGINEYFFREFSEKKAFPLGINIVMYALTH
jgi:hypothetical protein